jgi:hypothetical protein
VDGLFSTASEYDQRGWKPASIRVIYAALEAPLFHGRTLAGATGEGSHRAVESRALPKPGA